MPTTVRSRITSKSQNTIPKAVRDVLGVGPGDDVAYVIEGDRVTLVNPAAAAERDPVLVKFLDFIERDMAAHPESITSFPVDLHRRMADLTAGDDIDLDAPIEGDLAE
jgi:antitoxin PrlF